jgi:hypothetical protein
MNKFRYYFYFINYNPSLFSCSKDDSVTVQPLRDSQELNADNLVIEEYLNSII